MDTSETETPQKKKDEIHWPNWHRICESLKKIVHSLGETKFKNQMHEKCYVHLVKAINKWFENTHTFSFGRPAKQCINV